MSVHVEINIADGTARRHLFIHRVDPKSDPRRMDDVANYAVEVEGGGSRTMRRATFYHRYGDSELSLVAEAILALTGHIPDRAADGVDLADAS